MRDSENHNRSLDNDSREDDYASAFNSAPPTPLDKDAPFISAEAFTAPGAQPPRSDGE